MVAIAALLLGALQVPNLQATPTVRIGGADGQGAAELTRVTNVTRQSNGTIVIADEGALEVRIFGADGRHRTTFGRRGEGPGEFQSLSGLFVGAGDSLWTWDSRLHRLTVFTPAGRYARSMLVRPSRAGYQPRPIALIGDKVLLAQMRSYSPKEGEQGIQRDSMHLALLDARGAHVRDLGGMANEEVFVRSDGNSVSVSDLPFGNHAVVAANGTMWLRGDTRDGRLELLDTSGRVVRTIAAGFPTQNVSAEHIRAARQRETARLPQNEMGQAIRANIERKYAALPAQMRLPAVRHALMGADGRVWVQRPVAAPTEPSEWMVYDAAGAARGRVVLPAGSEIMAAGAGWVVTRSRDDLDVPVVTLWRIP